MAPSNVLDNRFPPRETSPSRFGGRRPSANYGNVGSRQNDADYQGEDHHTFANRGRDPPRGPRAYRDGPRGGGYGPRGRGFGHRGGVHDRDPRDLRDPRDFPGPPRARDWVRRGSSRERRVSPLARSRSRSPPYARDLRGRHITSRETEHNRLRHDSREDDPYTEDAWQQPTYRGGFRGRGRGDSDYHNRGRESFTSRRESFSQRSRSRDRTWDGPPRDDYARERPKDFVQVNEGIRTREDRDPRRDIAHFRSAHSSPRFGSPQATSFANASSNNNYKGRYDNGFSEIRDTPVFDRDSRADYASGPTENSIPQPPSSPPQPPAIPAFGSIVPQIPKEDSSRHPESVEMTQHDTVHHQKDSSLPARSRSPLGQMSHTQVQQAHDRRDSQLQGRDIPGHDVRGPEIEDKSRPDLILTSGDHSSFTGGFTSKEQQQYHDLVESDSSHQNKANQYARSYDGSPEFASNQSRSYHPSPQDARRNASNPLAMRSEASIGPDYAMRDDMPQRSPGMKIPTGPRADRVPVRGAHTGRGGTSRQSMLRGAHPPSLTWTRPGLDKPRGPSIMNKVPPRPEYVERERVRKEEEQDLLAQGFHAQHTDPKPASPKQTDELKVIPIQESSSAMGRNVEHSKEQEELYGHSSRKHPDDEAQSAGIPVSVGAAPMNEELPLDIDKEYLKDETAYEEEMKFLETRKPKSPCHNEKLLALLEECDALAWAAEERARVGDLDPSSRIATSPRMPLQTETSGESSTIQEEDFVVVTAPVRRAVTTPPVDSLPFLASVSSSPQSEFEVLEDEFRAFNLIGHSMLEVFSEQRKEQADLDEDVLEDISERFRDWRGGVYDYIEANGIVEMDVPIPDGQVTPAPEIAPVSLEGRRGGRNASDLELELALAVSLREAEVNKLQEKVWPDLDRESTIPAMLTSSDPEIEPFIDLNSAVDTRDVLIRMEYWLPEPDFSTDEQRMFETYYMYYPKKFGHISKEMPGRNYRDCLKHYYLTKAKEIYKEKERGKGRRGRKALRGGAGVRPKANALMPLFDGADNEAPAAAVTDTGRPRRAAAPTFGDIAEAEPVTPLPKRSALALKGDNVGDTPVERPSAKRTRGAGNKERGGRRGKAATLLNAGPLGVSPQKIEKEISRPKIKEPKVEPDTQADELEFAHVLAGMQNAPNAAFPVTSNVFPESRGAPAVGLFRAQDASNMVEQSPQQIPVIQDVQISQRSDPTSTNSYWSVPEATDFRTYLGYFGTDWQSIAQTMKTKSATMIKNYYHRETKPDKPHSQVLQQIAQDADEKRRRGEDPGPVPPPSQIPKRRYDSSAHMVPQRTLIPIADNSTAGFESPALQPRPSQVSPPQVASLAPRTTSTSQTEQNVAPVSTQAQRNLLSNPTSTFLPSPSISTSRNHNVNHGPLQEEPTRSVFPVTPSAQQELSARQDIREHRPIREMALHQDPHLAHRTPQEFLPMTQSSAHAQRGIGPETIPSSGQQFQVIRDLASGHVHLEPARTTEVDSSSSDQSFRQSQPSGDGRPHIQQDVLGRRVQQELPQNTRPYETVNPTPHRANLNENTRIASLITPAQDIGRSSSVPVTQVSQVPPPESRPLPAAPRRVNVMSLLNDEPSDPKPKKKTDERPMTESAPPQSGQNSNLPHQPYPQTSQIHARQEYVTDPVGPSHSHQSRTSFTHTPQPSQHQALSSQHNRDSGQAWSHLQQQRRHIDQNPYGTSGRNSPQHHPVYPSQASRPSFPNLQRAHAPSPPPLSAHSRTSSYTAPSPLHQQQHQGPPPSITQNPALQARGPAVQENPYRGIHASQHLTPHPHHAVQPPQPQNPASNAPSQVQHQAPHPLYQNGPPQSLRYGSQIPAGPRYEAMVKQDMEMFEILRQHNEQRQQMKMQQEQQQQQQQQQQRQRHVEGLPYQHDVHARPPNGPSPTGHQPPIGHSQHARPPSSMGAVPPLIESRAHQDMDFINQPRDQEQRARVRDRERERYTGTPPIYGENGRYGPPPQGPGPSQYDGRG